MPIFIYTARSRTGEKVEGTLEAANRQAALLHIERQGQTPVTVEEKLPEIPRKVNCSTGNEDVEMENRRQIKNWKTIVIIGLILLCCSMVLNVMVLREVKAIKSCMYDMRNSIETDVDSVHREVCHVLGIVGSIEGDVSDIYSIKKDVENIKSVVDGIESDVDKILRR